MDYRAGNVPQDPDELPGFFSSELPRLQEVLNNAQSLMWLRKLHVAPAKPRDGMIAYADGSDWQPNGTGGAGIWYFNGTSWVQLG